jgi:hypothetical protein
MHRIGLAVLVVCSLVGGGADAGPRGSLAFEVASLRNSDVEWDGNYFGLWPQAATARAKRIEAAGVDAIPHLRRALRDPERYVAAHVLLCHVSNRPFQFSASEYNGLAVELFADGRVQIPDQRAKIVKIWSQKPTRSPNR